MEENRVLTSRTLWLLVAAAALTVGNIYYNQPLLGEIAKTFDVSAAQVGLTSTFTQLGYVGGLIFITPLGDVSDKRKLLVVTLLVAALAMLGSALSGSFVIFLVLAFLLGLSSVAVQLILPYIADLSPDRSRAKNMGLVISSSLLGILLSRTLSGFVGSHFGWRVMYFFGAALMLMLAVFLKLSLPKDSPPQKIKYPALIKSLWTLFRDLKALRLIALTGAFVYAAFTAFWASLVFYLSSDVHHLGAGTAGAFGLVGAAGALASNLVGRHVDRIGGKRMVLIAIVVMAVSYLIMGIFGASLIGLVIGVILLDMGAQSASIANQTEIYRLYNQARTRLNTIYKIMYFIGGATGAALSTVAWQHAGWWGVCGVGVMFLLFAMANHVPLMLGRSRGNLLKSQNL